MTQSLSLYWHRLTQRTNDERAEAPVLDLAGCFGSPATAVVRPETLRARLADPAPVLPAPR